MSSTWTADNPQHNETYEWGRHSLPPMRSWASVLPEGPGGLGSGVRSKQMFLKGEGGKERMRSDKGIQRRGIERGTSKSTTAHVLEHQHVEIDHASSGAVEILSLESANLHLMSGNLVKKSHPDLIL